jgi:SAM-dependent methyltransferase
MASSTRKTPETAGTQPPTSPTAPASSLPLINSDTCREGQLFDAKIYRSLNIDLHNLNDDACARHFVEFGKRERRLFGNVHTAHERISMKWLRGQGIEIGAGSNPTKLFGSTDVKLAEFDQTFFYGGTGADHFFSIDDPQLLNRPLSDRYDFAIASHVLEHADSFIWGLKNLIDLVVSGGIAFIALPCKAHLHDREWMPYFDFQHHLEEFQAPRKYSKLHDDLVIREHKRMTGETITIPENERFMHHKHNYEFDEWFSLIALSLQHLGSPARIVDAAVGYERLDTLVVVEKAS